MIEAVNKRLCNVGLLYETRCNIPEGCHLLVCRRENLKFTKDCEKPRVNFAMSLPSNNLRTAKWVAMKFGTRELNQSFDTFQFWLKSENSGGHFAKTYMRFCAHVKPKVLYKSCE